MSPSKGYDEKSTNVQKKRPKCRVIDLNKVGLDEDEEPNERRWEYVGTWLPGTRPGWPG